MRINPIYQFDTTTDTGIDQVPVNAKVMVMDDGTGNPSEFIKKSMGAFTGTSTIADFLNDPTSFVGQTITSISELSGSIADLSGIDITTVPPVVDDYLKFDGTNWVPGSPQTVSIDDLADIDTSTVAPVTGQTLKFDGTSWVPGDDIDTTYAAGTGIILSEGAFSADVSLSLITDVDLSTAPTDGQALVYDETNTKWVAGSIASSISVIGDLTDVDLSTAPEDGQTLSYDATNSVWIATTPAQGVTTFSALSDVPVYAEGDAGKVVRVNATEDGVEYANLGIGDAFDVDVATTAPVAGDYMVFDGTNWAPAAHNPKSNIVENEIVSGASQTDFVISGVIFGITECEVFTNGIRDRKADYSVADDGTDTTLTFGTARSENDIVDIIVYSVV